MIIAARLFTIVIGSTLLGAGYIELYKPELDWVPSEEIIKIEDGVRDDQKELIKNKTQVIDEAGIDLERFLGLLEAGTLVIDGRTAEEFAEGHLETPYIVNVTPDEMLQQVFLLDGLFFTDPPVPIVLYCRGIECDDSKISYVTLRRTFGELLDQGTVKIYLAGWDGIQENDLPTATGPSEPMDVMVNLVLNDQPMFGQVGMEQFSENNLVTEPNAGDEPNAVVDPNAALDPNQAFDPNLAIDPNIVGAAL